MFGVKPPTYLAFLLLTVMMAVSIWDVIAYAVDSPRDTVSAILGDWSKRFPMLAVAIGVLVGHLFWPQDSSPK